MKKRKKGKIVMKGEEDLSEKRKFRREIGVEKNTVTKVSDVMILNNIVIQKCQMCRNYWRRLQR